MSFSDVLTQPLDRHGPQLLHTQIRDRIERLIRAGQLPSNHRLPTELELSRSLGVNHRTVRRAMLSLVDKGLVYRSPRAGTFVSDSAATDQQSIGFLYPAPFHTRMLSRAHALQWILEDRNCDVKIFGYREGFFSDTDLLKKMEDSGLSGAFIVPLGTVECREQLARLEANGFPYVRFSNIRHGNLLKSPGVSGDNLQVLTLAVETLISRGHSRIGYLGRPGWPYNTGILRKLLDDYGLKSTGSHIYEVPSSTWDHQVAVNEEMLDSICNYLKAHNDLTAIIVDKPSIVLMVIRQAHYLNLQIPEQSSILATQDQDSYAAMYPPVTAMSLSDDQMVRTAVDLLEQVIDTPRPHRYREHYPQKSVPFTLVRQDGGSIRDIRNP